MSRTFAGAAVAAILLLAACGSTGPSSSDATSSITKGNGVSSDSPAQIIAAAQAALRSSKGFILAGALTQGASATQVQMVDAGLKLQMRVDESGKVFQIIVLPGASYVRANRAFWIAESGPTLARLANRWIEVPASTTKQLSSSLGSLAPSTLARCLGEDLGTLTRAGTTTVDGDHAVVIRDAGNAPGDTPGTLAVATNGPAFPLRITATGPTRPGGKVDVCNDGKGNDEQGTLTLSHFNHVPAIKPPDHPVQTGTTSGSAR